MMDMSRKRIRELNKTQVDDAETIHAEPRFGVDFSKVRIQTNPELKLMIGVLNARAFTLGGDICFGEGQYKSGYN